MKTIKPREPLKCAARKLIEAAHDYWKQYQKDIGHSAVVWLESDSGHVILLTRNEYASPQNDCGYAAEARPRTREQIRKAVKRHCLCRGKWGSGQRCSACDVWRELYGKEELRHE